MNVSFVKGCLPDSVTSARWHIVREVVRMPEFHGRAQNLQKTGPKLIFPRILAFIMLSMATIRLKRLQHLEILTVYMFI